jgi:hypothetical protein
MPTVKLDIFKLGWEWTLPPGHVYCFLLSTSNRESITQLHFLRPRTRKANQQEISNLNAAGNSGPSEVGATMGAHTEIPQIGGRGCPARPEERQRGTACLTRNVVSRPDRENSHSCFLTFEVVKGNKKR